MQLFPELNTTCPHYRLFIELTITQHEEGAHMGRLTSIRVSEPSIVQFPRVYFEEHLDVIGESRDDLSVETSTFLIEETRISER